MPPTPRAKVTLLTGRKHQIRVQLSAVGCPIKGDLKYGDKRSNPDGSISLLAREIEFEHPVSHRPIHVIAPLPDTDPSWAAAAPEDAAPATVFTGVTLPPQKTTENE